MPLRQIDADLWSAEGRLRFLGVEVGARMTVVRLRDGGLWIHSPIRMSDPLRAAVDALGPVRFLVAPNRYHHLFIADWASAYQQARTYAAPGLCEKRSDLLFHEVLNDGTPTAWNDDLDQVVWRGAPTMNEVLFLHRPSRTLILTDAVHNIGPQAPTVTRAVFKLLGGYGGLGTWLPDRLVNRDRQAARQTIERVLQWDFSRVIMAHGRIAEGAGPADLRAAYHWVQERRSKT
jgi:hypothetical protein